ncbi:uncharacterized protein PgNI_11620 [Pyricularia grisea]|uniref:Uncharacterized protein n=1 Tax=Pyricularia grisea TaxID=148305 RepID=A0A6P8ANX7_PYRGI|nr:uncharacterized protein PgNI_11620 [Pyricularia grisea]TLD03737.1 hypothetical protein PgNI_11620 [Pyricularia grisea]
MKKQKYNAVIDYRPRKPGAPPLVLGNNVARDEPGPGQAEARNVQKAEYYFVKAIVTPKNFAEILENLQLFKKNLY